MFFCRYCGQKVYKDSIFCSFCGKKLTTDETDEIKNVENIVIEEQPAETIAESAEPVFESDPEFVWDLHEFPDSPKQEFRDTPKEHIIEPQGQAFPESSKTKSVELQWGEEKLTFEIIDDEPDNAAEVTESIVEEQALPVENIDEEETLVIEEDEEETLTIEEISKELEKMEASADFDGSDAGKINKFYTFNKKNEEFQKLLDKEYERVKNKEQELDRNHTAGDEQQEQDEEAMFSEPPVEEFSESHDADEEHSQEEKIIFDNDTLSKKFDTKEFNSDLIEFALERAGIKIPRDAIETRLARDTYESDFKPRFVEESEDEQELLQNDIIEEIFQDLESEQERVTVDGLPVIDPQKQEAFKELERMWDAREQNEVDGKNEFREEPEKDEKRSRRKTQEKSYLQDDNNNEPEKGKAIKAIVVILIIIFALKILMLGIVQLSPNSLAGEFINRHFSFAISWFTNLGERADRESVYDGEDYIGIVLAPEADKNRLIAGQLHYNQNVEIIEANDELGFNPEQSYTDERIRHSVPIENNFWFAGEAGAGHFDSAVVATLIQYHSMRLDYVNGGDESVFEIVGPNAEMLLRQWIYGVESERVREVQIGEIRQHGDSFFVWQHVISEHELEDGTVVERSDSRVYELQAIGEKMLVIGSFPA